MKAQKHASSTHIIEKKLINTKISILIVEMGPTNNFVSPNLFFYIFLSLVKF